MGGRASVAAALAAAAAASASTAAAGSSPSIVSSPAAARAAAAAFARSRPPASHTTSTPRSRPFLPVRAMSTGADGDGAGGPSIKERKAALRKEVAAKLRALDDAYIREQSRPLFARLLALPAVAASRCLSIYLSMPSKEVPTFPELLGQLGQGADGAAAREVYVPKVTGPNSADMVMLRVAGPDAVAAFPKSKWGIPEPPLPEPLEKERDDGTYTGRMDLVVVPGVAFDAQCRRLGHGKGYYDCFLARLAESNAAKGGPKPYTVGLALTEQIIPEVPTDTFDVLLDAVVTPMGVFLRDG